MPFLSEPQAKYPLRVLRLENPGVYCAISSRSIIAISQTCTNLVSFSVWCGANIDFSSLLTLAQSCPLQSLKVDKTHGAFPHLLADLLRSADELETLWLVPRRTPSLPPIQANLTQLLLRTCSFVPRSLFRNGGKLLLLSAAEDAVQLKEGWIACPTNEMKERVRSLYEMCGIKEDKFRETRMWYAV